jgi:hypothetical protein
MPEKTGEDLTAFLDSDVDFRFFHSSVSVSRVDVEKGLRIGLTNVVATPSNIKNDEVFGRSVVN